MSNKFLLQIFDTTGDDVTIKKWCNVCTNYNGLFLVLFTLYQWISNKMYPAYNMWLQLNIQTENKIN